MLKVCVKCGRERSTKYMQEAVFLNFVGNEPAGVWKCNSTQSCHSYRKKNRVQTQED